MHFQITSDGVNYERVLSFADLQNPNALLRGLGGGLANELDLPVVPSSPAATADTIKWVAYRDRLTIGHEPVTAYRLETRVLDQPAVFYISSLGEILRAELPGGMTAELDEWNKS